jgi:hypothetical protein
MSKISRAIFAINKVKNILPRSALKSLYYSMVHCHLIYGLLAWGKSKSLDKIFKLQKRAIRCINNKAYRAHTEPLFKSNRILNIKDLYECQVRMFMHDYKYNRLPISFTNIFEYENQPTATTRRQVSNIYRGVPRTKFSEYLPRHEFVTLWNTLNENDKSIRNKNGFKRNIRNKYIDNYAASVQCYNQYCKECYKGDINQ